MRDPYEVLGVPRTATESEIRDAFRRKAREHHPDQNPGDDGAHARFQELNAAFQVLSDAQRRARYDRIGDTTRPSPGPSPGAGFGGLEDLLRDLFGGFASQRVDRGDLQAAVEIDFREAATGCTKTLRYQRKEPCRACRGQGRTGTGTCSECGGRGHVVRDLEIEVSVPAGIENGTTQTVIGGGHCAHPGRPAGDLELIIQVRADARFQREGDDVHGKVVVPFHVCALGGSIEVDTVFGTELLQIPAGTQHGERVRLRGRGIPHRFRSGNGDHYAEIKVSVPSITTDRARDLVSEYQAAALSEDGLLDRMRSWFAD